MFDFSPVTDRELQPYNKNAAFQSKAKARAEDKYSINEFADGRRGVSELEKSMFSVISFPERDRKKALLNGVYFLVRNTELNREFGSNFDGSLYKLKVDAAASGASQSEIDGAVYKARYDHLLANSKDAQILFKRFGKDALHLFVQAWCDPTPANRQKVLDFTKQFVPDYDPNNLKFFDEVSFKICFNIVNESSIDAALLDAFDKMLNNRINKKSNASLEVSN
jgi:hypothetical protein